MGFAHVRALISVCALALALPASAHEIGTTRVDVLLRNDHTFEVRVVTAPQALLGKLEAAAGRPRSPALSPDALRARLQSFAPLLERSADIRFGNRVVPRVDVLPIETTGAAIPTSVTVRYSGEIPAHATPFTWQYQLTYAAYALTVRNEGDPVAAVQWLDGQEASRPFPLARRVIPPTRLGVAKQYLALGFTHIIPRGVDHILFVLGIFLLATRLKEVLEQVTAFTVAHSITLALTMYGVVSLPPRIVEPAIALSIAYIAVENIVATKISSWRVAVIFSFGLLHGMGFAGVLRELGLPRKQFLTALVAFNVGVELAQLTVIAAAALLFAHWAREKSWYRARIVVPLSLVIAVTGLVWMVQRAVLGG